MIDEKFSKMGNSALLDKLETKYTVLHIGPHGSGKSVAAQIFLKNTTNSLYFNFLGKKKGVS